MGRLAKSTLDTKRSNELYLLSAISSVGQISSRDLNFTYYLPGVKNNINYINYFNKLYLLFIKSSQTLAAF